MPAEEFPTLSYVLGGLWWPSAALRTGWWLSGVSRNRADTQTESLTGLATLIVYDRDVCTFSTPVNVGGE